MEKEFIKLRKKIWNRKEELKKIIRTINGEMETTISGAENTIVEHSKNTLGNLKNIEKDIEEFIKLKIALNNLNKIEKEVGEFTKKDWNLMEMYVHKTINLKEFIENKNKLLEENFT